MFTYYTKGTCCRAFNIELEGDVVKEIQHVGGCDGNLKAMSQIAKGMTVDQLARAWEGNTCGNKSTSCADQLVKALRAAQVEQAVTQAEQAESLA